MKTLYILLAFLCGIVSAKAQKASEKNTKNSTNTLFTAGLANTLIGGLYDGYYKYSDLKKHGNFGLGAPDKLDGEILILDGKIYQTQHSGKTFEVQDTAKTPFSVVNFFKVDKSIKIKREMNKNQLFQYLDSVLVNLNGMYAIHLRGDFKYIKTRAFPPVDKKPYTPLAQMLSKQAFFEFKNQKGDFVGHRLPPYMEGANIAGYHLHFISDKKDKGGHIIDFLTENVTVEIDLLNSFIVDVPTTYDFNHFDFSKDLKNDVKSVENGQK